MSWKNKMESVSPPWECSQNKFGRRHVYWDHALYTKSLNWLFLYSFVFLSFLSTFLKKGQAKTQGKCKLLGHPRLKVPTVPQRPAEGAPKTGSNFLRGSHWVQIFALLPHCPDHRGGGGLLVLPCSCIGETQWGSVKFPPSLFFPSWMGWKRKGNGNGTFTRPCCVLPLDECCEALWNSLSTIPLPSWRLFVMREGKWLGPLLSSHATSATGRNGAVCGQFPVIGIASSEQHVTCLPLTIPLVSLACGWGGEVNSGNPPRLASLVTA